MARIVRIVILMGVISMVSSFEIPDYCSKDMSTRDIPPLPEEEQDGGNMILQQVQVLIRHGARTPYAAHTCWRDYDIKWNNCNVSEIMEFSPSTFISDQTYWRFRLLYDAYPNELGGNCLTGQLVSEGYDQEVRNGELLKAAYIGSGHHKLFNTSVWEDLNHKTIYLRSDDEQRTLMSGQILIHSMFDLQKTEVVNWHTGDYILDTLSPNSFLCPALTSIATAAESSLEYQQTLASDRVKSLQNSLDQILGTESSGEWSWRFIQDCLMTTLCSGKETALPKEMTQELLDEIVHQVEYRYGYKSLYNDSEYSKLAMTNTAYKIRTRLEKMMRAQDSAASDALKFVLYAGHDTTLSAILAAILGQAWDQRWPPYASMLSIELYQHLNTQEHFFRLVYNGQVLFLPQCSSSSFSLCEIRHLLSALAFGRDGHLPECYHTIRREDSQVNTNHSKEETIHASETVLFTTGEWLLLTTALSILSSLFCALLYMAATKQLDGLSSYPNHSSLRRTLTHFPSSTGGGGSVAYDPVPAHDQL